MKILLRLRLRFREWRETRAQRKRLQAAARKMETSRELLLLCLSSHLPTELRGKNPPRKSAAGAVLRFTGFTLKTLDRTGKSLFNPDRWERGKNLLLALLALSCLRVWFLALQRQAPQWPTNGGKTESAGQRLRRAFLKMWPPRWWKRPA